MGSLKWVIGVPVAIVVVVVLKFNMPEPKIVRIQTEVSDSQSSLSLPDKDGRVIYNAPSNSYTPVSEKQKFENAASACWSEYERKSLSDAEKRQIAYMCEGLDKRVTETR